MCQECGLRVVKLVLLSCSWCAVRHRAALCCAVQHHAVVSAVLCCAALHCVVLCCVVLCCVVLCCVVLCCVVLCCVVARYIPKVCTQANVSHGTAAVHALDPQCTFLPAGQPACPSKVQFVPHTSQKSLLELYNFEAAAAAQAAGKAVYWGADAQAVPLPDMVPHAAGGQDQDVLGKLSS